MIPTCETMRLHIRFNGRSEDLDLAILALGRDASDIERRWPSTTTARSAISRAT